jgi:hypothetical protein
MTKEEFKKNEDYDNKNDRHTAFLKYQIPFYGSPAVFFPEQVSRTILKNDEKLSIIEQNEKKISQSNQPPSPVMK